jgi:hypothetical protein
LGAGYRRKGVDVSCDLEERATVARNACKAYLAIVACREILGADGLAGAIRGLLSLLCALFPFFPALGFVFFGLLAGPFLTFFVAPAATLLAAFFGVPLDFFFFFFKVLLLSSSHLAEKRQCSN